MKEAQARNIILSTCSESIQFSLDHAKTAKECWDTLADAFASEGIIQKFDVWSHYARLLYNGEPIEEYCNSYRSALERVQSAGIQLDDDIKPLHFISSVERHFSAWSFSKREQMCTSSKTLPSLAALIRDLTDECRRLNLEQDHSISSSIFQLQTTLFSKLSLISPSSLVPSFTKKPVKLNVTVVLFVVFLVIRMIVVSTNMSI